MTCIFLGHKEMRSICHASLTGISPSITDMLNYCESEEHYRCPILLAKLMKTEFRRKTCNRETAASYGN